MNDEIAKLVEEANRLKAIRTAAHEAYRNAEVDYSTCHAALRSALIVEAGWEKDQVIKTTKGDEMKISYISLSADGQLFAWCYRRIKSGAWSQRPESRVNYTKVDLQK